MTHCVVVDAHARLKPQSTLRPVTRFCHEETPFCRRAPQYVDARSANRCLYALDFHFTLSDAHPVAARFQPIHDVRVYGHLRFKEVPLIGVIVASWLIAFVEYCVAV